MKPNERVPHVHRVAFRAGEYPELKLTGGPMVVLVSDTLMHVTELIAELAESKRHLKKARQEITTMKKAISPAKDTARGRGARHLFPEKLTVPEDTRIRRACAAHDVDYDEVIDCARLYSEMNAVKYSSWPAAIEVALKSEYKWIQSARKKPSGGGGASGRRSRAGVVARNLLDPS